MRNGLVHMNKEQLLEEWKALYGIHGRSWRRKLKGINKWHLSEYGANAWQNTLAGTVGNEALRQIVGDMRAIANDGVKPEVTLSPKEAKKLVKRSMESLKVKPTSIDEIEAKRKARFDRLKGKEQGKNTVNV